MRLLDRKLSRDLWHLRGPAVAIALVVACGVASFVSMRSMVYHLKLTQDRYYDASHFADLFAHVKRAPRSVARELAELPGIAAIETRVSGDVTLDVPRLSEPAAGHVVGIPTRRPLALNRLSIRQGRMLVPGRSDEILLSEGFAEANALQPGDSLGAVLNGRWRRLRIVGVALEPEFIYETRPGEMIPDRRRYGILYMDEDAAATAFGLDGAWNDAAFALAPGASASAVIAELDRLLDRYGTLGAYDRSLQSSHRFVTDEIEQNRRFAAIIPAIFLGVAAFLLHLVLSRIVAQQREQIGMMKAFGVSSAAMVRHFVLFSLGPVLPGALLGSALGLWAANGLAGLYAQYYRIPDVTFSPRASVVLVGTAIAVIAAVTGAVSALRRVLALQAAEAMRAEAPARYRRGVADRLGMSGILGPVGRMTIRAIERRPLQASLSVIGMAAGVAVVMVGSFGFDSVSKLRDVQFDYAQREDIAVSFTVPRGAGAPLELARLPGVLRVEPTRSLAVRLRHAQRSRRVALIGVDESAELRQAVNENGTVVPMPGDGLLLSNALAQLLEVVPGDTLRVEVLTGRRAAVSVRVGGLLDDLVGTIAYAPTAELLRIAGEGEAIDGAVMAVDPLTRDAVYSRLKKMPGVSGVGARAATLKNFDDSIQSSFSVTLFTLTTFAGLLAVGVVYNTARIALSERGRELASLRVLGFTRGEVARMLFGEQGLLAAVAIPAGFAVGAAFCWTMSVGLQSDLFRFPLVIRPRTYALAASVLVVAWVGSAILVRRRLDRIDLIAVLKTRE